MHFRTNLNPISFSSTVEEKNKQTNKSTRFKERHFNIIFLWNTDAFSDTVCFKVRRIITWKLKMWGEMITDLLSACLWIGEWYIWNEKNKNAKRNLKKTVKNMVKSMTGHGYFSITCLSQTGGWHIWWWQQDFSCSETGFLLNVTASDSLWDCSHHFAVSVDLWIKTAWT